MHDEHRAGLRRPRPPRGGSRNAIGAYRRAIDCGALPRVGFAHELAEVISGKVTRTSDGQITVFKSVGLSAEDLILARAASDLLAP